MPSQCQKSQQKEHGKDGCHPAPDIFHSTHIATNYRSFSALIKKILFTHLLFSCWNGVRIVGDGEILITDCFLLGILF